MRSYNNLWGRFISRENIKLAIKKASKGKTKKHHIQVYLTDPFIVDRIRAFAWNYVNAEHEPKQIKDGTSGKIRIIIVPTFYELVVQHMVINVLEPIFMKGMYAHSYASIPGRGIHKGKKVVSKWVKNGGRNLKYVLKMDIRKFFDSVSHDRLLQKLRGLIRDDRFYALIEKVIDVTEVGIPLGFYSSQWFANYFLQSLDYYIKQGLQAVYYIRYMDDMVIFGPNKKVLHKIRQKISIYLNEFLGLTLKDNWQVFLFHFVDKNGNERGRFLDFMGFRFYRNRTTMRHGIFYRALRSIRQLSRKFSVFFARRFLSYIGWFKCTDTFAVYDEYVLHGIRIDLAKKLVSDYERKIMLCGATV